MQILNLTLAGAVGAGAGIATWRWLARATYRRTGDHPRLPARASWVAIPVTVLAALALAAGAPGPLLIPAAIYVAGGVALTWIDLDVHRVPDTVLALLASLMALAIVVVAADTGSWSPVAGAALGAIGLGGLYLLMALIGSMGLGDVKLATVSGLILGSAGWTSLVLATALSFALAALIALALLAGGRARGSTHIAFGPAIIAGTTLALIL